MNKIMQESWIRWSFALLLLIGTASMPVVAADGESKPEAETAADSDLGEGHEEDHDEGHDDHEGHDHDDCLLYTSPSPRDLSTSRMPSSA